MKYTSKFYCLLITAQTKSTFRIVDALSNTYLSIKNAVVCSTVNILFILFGS